MQRHIFDPKQPQGSMSLMNLRNTLRGLFQGDLMPLRPRASLVLDDMEYPSDAAAAAEWSGTGITVTYSTTKQEGNYSIQAATDATPDRILANTQSLDIVAFGSLTLWTRCASISSAIKFYVKDSSGNISYWDVTTHGTVDTWKQDTIDLTTADSNNGTDADLSDITEYGYSALDASETYLFDTITAIVGLCVAVDASNIGSFYKQVYLSSQPLEIGAKASPAITPPAANPRIDILTINSAGTLAWVAGDEAASPAAKWASFTAGAMPICLVYCKTTMAKVVDYEDAAANPNEAYIYADLRPMFGNTETNKLKADSADATPQYLDSLIDTAMFIISAGDVLQLKDGGVEMEKLESGSASPGNSKYYGTNAAGAKGFFSFLINLVTMVTGVLPNANGGTNQSTYAQGDILYASAANVLSKLAKGAAGKALVMGASVPAWGTAGLSSVSQGDLNTTTGEVSASATSTNATVFHLLTLPGGMYGFFPQSKASGELTGCTVGIGSDGSAGSASASYATRIIVFRKNASGGQRTWGISLNQRYITASGHDHWIFLLVDKETKDVISSYQAPDHPSANQGGATEIEIPHPFGSYDPEKHEIVIVDNADLITMKQRVTRQKSLLQIINNDYFIDDTKRPNYTPREIVKIDEYGDLPGIAIKTMRTPEWAKIMIGAPDFTLKRQMVETLPDNILFKKMRRR